MIRLIGAIWVLPVAILIWLLYLLPLLALGKITYQYKQTDTSWRWVWRFHVIEDGGWYDRLLQKKYCFAVPFAIIVRRKVRWKKVKHELGHTDQWLILGPLFLPVYLTLLAIFGYANHPLEKG